MPKASAAATAAGICSLERLCILNLIRCSEVSARSDCPSRRLLGVGAQKASRPIERGHFRRYRPRRIAQAARVLRCRLAALCPAAPGRRRARFGYKKARLRLPWKVDVLSTGGLALRAEA